jgi:hypothetical protein
MVAGLSDLLDENVSCKEKLASIELTNNPVFLPINGVLPIGTRINACLR